MLIRMHDENSQQSEAVEPDQPASAEQPAPSVSGPPPQPVTMQSHSHKKTPLIIVGVIFLVIAAGAGGYLFKNSQAKNDADKQQAQISALQKQVKSLQEKTSTQSIANSSDYTGWKSYTLQNEKLTFLYPPTWSAGPWPAATPSATQDMVELTSADGMKCNIEDGISNDVDGSTSFVPNSAIKLTYMKKPAYFVFANPKQAGGAADTSKVEGAVLLTNPKDASSRPLGKYAEGTSNAPGASNGKYIAFSCSPPTPITLQQALASQDYKDAKLIVQSMHY
jgi:hypothetical protein